MELETLQPGFACAIRFRFTTNELKCLIAVCHGKETNKEISSAANLPFESVQIAMRRLSLRDVVIAIPGKEHHSENHYQIVKEAF